MPPFTDTLARLSELSAPFAPAPAAHLTDEQLLNTHGAITELRIDAQAAVVAAEIAHRSRRELGHDGLAQTHGQRTPEALISQLAGTSVRHARTLVKAGELLSVEAPGAAARAADEMPPWLAAIGTGVACADISIEAAEVIRTRLGEAAKRHAIGEPSDADRAAFSTRLAESARLLVSEAPSLTIERLAERAARERDELDLAGVATREHARHAQRYLRFARQVDGMTRVTGLLDPESAAIVVPVLDAITSPRRGGPRFVEPDAVSRADELVRDERTTEQLTLDAFVELVRIGARVDDGALLGDRKPAVRILVAQRDLEAPVDTDGHRVGAAFFEGQADAVSVATAERYICSGAAVPILFDGDGRVLNLGREQRLFSQKQRLAMAARDGGCRMCDRPPSWAEAHHIDHWDEHHGRTDIDDGILLCKFCHLLVHNRRWRITRTGGDYFLERPHADGVRRRIPLPSRSAAYGRMRDSA